MCMHDLQGHAAQKNADSPDEMHLQMVKAQRTPTQVWARTGAHTGSVPSPSSGPAAGAGGKYRRALLASAPVAERSAAASVLE